jgi:hypothetical protein
VDLDRLRPGQLASRQDASLRRYVRDEVYPYSRLLRPRLDRSGLGQAGIQTVADLQRLPPLDWADVDARAAVLDASGDVIKAHGPLVARARLKVADFVGRRAAFARDRLEPTYKPIHWCRQGEAPIAMTATDLTVLAGIGRRLLDAAGVRALDRVVTLEDPATLGFWQLTLGCRDGGVLATHLGPKASPGAIAACHPTVLAGGTSAVALALAAGLEGVRLVIIIGEVLGDADRDGIRDAARGADVRCAWAPDGVRALWVECGARLLHTWPDAEVIEVVDPLSGAPVREGEDGELLWTALGWRGTVLARLRTQAFGRMDDGTCLCGRTTPRLSIVPLDPPFAGALDADPRVARWYAEVIADDGGAPWLRVYVAARRGAKAGLAQSLADTIGAEVMVVRPARIDALIASNGGDRLAGGVIR